MSKLRRICVLTGTRAEYGLLRPVMRAIQRAEDFELQIIATGSHLAPEFGSTVDAIDDDGFVVDAEVEMLLSADTAVGIAKSMGLGTIGFADALRHLEPDLLVVLGDRFEIIAAAVAALPARVPIAHISGGDVTEGAIDDAIRHAVTKLSHLHFVTNAPARQRVIQLGEDPQRVVLSGNPGLDELFAFQPVPIAELRRELSLPPCPHNVLVTYHPVTLLDEDPSSAFSELLGALDLLSEVGIVLTLPNADTGTRTIIDMATAFADRRQNVVVRASLGQRLYWSCLHAFDAIVGNSSSALIEAPAVGLPSIDVGDRQRGRLRSASTVHCSPDRKQILEAITSAIDRGRVRRETLYGDGKATDRILETLRGVEDASTLVAKRFHDVRPEGAAWDAR